MKIKPENEYDLLSQARFQKGVLELVRSSSEKATRRKGLSDGEDKEAVTY